ncbi:MAG: malto-oligosyltrehalose trehalohydrolase, partial [Halomonas sp.]|nr:malto-oligosyltrehalose trehalohydrolase [Halomonas sp.]
MFQPTFGARVIDKGQTRFMLWAPDARRVEVEIDGGPGVTMTADEEGICEAHVPCGHGARYRYRVFGADDDTGTLVPDPAARAQAGDIDGPSMVIDPRRYAWQHDAWRGRPWHETVLYELHVGTLGGFDGVRQRLPYLA